MYVPYRMPGELPPDPPKEKKRKRTKIIYKSSGIGLGGVIAVLCSWSLNHSVIWALIHACCSWFYVVYWMIVS